MKIISYFLIVAILISSSSIVSLASDKAPIELNEKQQMFTDIISSLTGHIETKWINPYTINVTYDQEHLDLMTQDEIDDEAKKMAKIGYDVTKQITCVKITDYKGKELTHKCEGITPS